MALTLKTASDIRAMEAAGRLAALVLAYARKFVKAGISTNELDQIANDFIRTHGGFLHARATGVTRNPFAPRSMK